MEIKLQFIETFPSIKEIKASQNDIISLLLLFENSKAGIPNLEKNIIKQEITLLTIQNYNQINPPLIKITILKNSSIIGFTDFFPFNDIKWINISNILNNYPNFKINIKCSFRNIKNKGNKNKINSPLNKSEKISSNISSKKIKNLVSPLKRNKKEIKNFEIIDTNKSTEKEEEDLNVFLSNSTKNLKEKKVFKTQNYYNNYSQINTTRNRFSIRMKTPPSYNILNKTPYEKTNKQNLSQKIIEMKEMEKYKNFFNLKEKKNKISEDEIIDKKKIIKKEKENNIIDNINEIYKNSSFEFNTSEEEKSISLDSISNDFNDKSNKIFNSVQNDFLIFYTEEYLKSIDKEMINLETQLLIEKIFDLQKAFHKQFKNLHFIYYKYKNIYNHFTDKFYILSKKFYKLKSKSKKVDFIKMKSDISNPKIKYDNIPLLFNQEIQIWKQMIYKQNFSYIKQSNKNFLITLFISIILSHKNKLSVLQKKYFNDFIEKYRSKKFNKSALLKEGKIKSERINNLSQILLSPKEKSISYFVPHTPSKNIIKKNLFQENIINNSNKQIKRTLFIKK